MSRLLTIEEQNRRSLKPRLRKNTGIECPICKVEMNLKNPGQLLMSNPPQAELICLSCGHQDKVFV